MLSVSGGDIRTDENCDVADGHGLEPDSTGSGQHSIEQAFAAKEANAQILSEVDGDLHSGLGCMEGTLLDNHF